MMAARCTGSPRDSSANPLIPNLPSTIALTSHLLALKTIIYLACTLHYRKLLKALASRTMGNGKLRIPEILVGIEKLMIYFHTK